MKSNKPLVVLEVYRALYYPVMWGNGRVECLDVGCLCVFLGGGLDVGFFSLCLCFFFAGKLSVNGFRSLQNVGTAENWGIIQAFIYMLRFDSIRRLRGTGLRDMKNLDLELAKARFWRRYDFLFYIFFRCT